MSDGGPAFPKEHKIGGHDGMSLRDWFAGQALITIYAGVSDASGSPADMAHASYTLADAMLAERERQP